jgi:hypothetical protein
MSYGIIFWGDLSHGSVIFKMQKRVFTIIKGCGYREPCIELFKELEILPLSSQCILFIIIVC